MNLFDADSGPPNPSAAPAQIADRLECSRQGLYLLHSIIPQTPKITAAAAARTDGPAGCNSRLSQTACIASKISQYVTGAPLAVAPARIPRHFRRDPASFARPREAVSF
jgi:hypothetical protein